MQEELDEEAISKTAAPGTHDIFVRAHTTAPVKEPGNWPTPKKWPDEVLVFDTETTIDTAQELNFGAYRRLKLGPAGYQCVEEGLFFADDLREASVQVLRRYVKKPKHWPDTEVKMYPPQTRLHLHSRSAFVAQVFWKSIRKGAMVVGFNLPFDLSRLAVKAGPAENGGWSLALSLRRSRKTGEIEANPERPRVVIKSIDSKRAFISLKSLMRPEEWPHEARFLDLHTLGRALRDESFTLKRSCKAFRVRGKMKHKPTGRVTIKEIAYCRQDVKATAHLLNAMKKEFDRHEIELRPDRAYSPAGIAKAYLLNPAHFGRVKALHRLC
jgi:hypothetical protein